MKSEELWSLRSKSEENLKENLIKGHTESTESTENIILRILGFKDYFYSKELRNIGMDRLLMDDSHRDDCLIFVENKGLILFEES